MPGPATPRVRRDVTKLQQDGGQWDRTLVLYALAVQKMKAKDAGKQPGELAATGWRFQTFIHGGAPDLGAATPREWGQCPHGGWFFLPWHRAYLHYFERIVRETIRTEVDVPSGWEQDAADWALPYWNYGRLADGEDGPQSRRCRELPPAFRQKKMPDGTTANPLYRPDREQGVNEGSFPDYAEVNPGVAMASTVFATPPGVEGHNFGSGNIGDFWPKENWLSHVGYLENVPHNAIHGFVGGAMAFASSPDDPIFWLHHANIDRLWAAWVDQGNANTTDDTWLTTPYHLRDETGAPVRSDARAVLDTARLGYVYESLSDGTGTAQGVGGAPWMAAVGSPDPLLAHSGPTTLSAREAHVSLTPAEEVDQPVSLLSSVVRPHTARTAEARRVAEGRRLVLTIENVRADAPPGTSYRVFVGARGKDDLDPASPHFVGHITFFGATGGQSGRPGQPAEGNTFSYDVTDVLRGLEQDGRWNGELPSVTLVPAPVNYPSGPGVPEALGSGAAQPRYERLTLSVV
ncbi:tyrosinase family protein [Streptomyces sp. NPDC049577]|uniref:tyrosinase family protein n=1 Tax=Streptomyces sp. NPDC049577 TaxID=3155153 RepID=UPI00343DFCAA